MELWCTKKAVPLVKNCFFIFFFFLPKHVLIFSASRAFSFCFPLMSFPLWWVTWWPDGTMCICILCIFLDLCEFYYWPHKCWEGRMEVGESRSDFNLSKFFLLREIAIYIYIYIFQTLSHLPPLVSTGCLSESPPQHTHYVNSYLFKLNFRNFLFWLFKFDWWEKLSFSWLTGFFFPTCVELLSQIDSAHL